MPHLVPWAQFIFATSNSGPLRVLHALAHEPVPSASEETVAAHFFL